MHTSVFDSESEDEPQGSTIVQKKNLKKNYHFVPRQKCLQLENIRTSLIFTHVFLKQIKNNLENLSDTLKNVVLARNTMCA